MFQEKSTSGLHAGSQAELRREVLRFTRDVGFQTVNAMAVVDHALGESEFICVNHTSEAYRAVAESSGNTHRDPVMQPCNLSGLPIVWEQSTYIRAGRHEKWEEQAFPGYRTGMAYALHLPGSRHFCIRCGP